MAAEQVLSDRNALSLTEGRQHTLDDVREALTLPRQSYRLGSSTFSPSKRKALLKLDPFDPEVLLRVIKHPEAYREVLEAVRLQAREACARVATTVARRRTLAGHEDGADAARQIANFIREDLSMEEEP